MIPIYRILPVIKKMPLHIESIASYDDYLLVGTKEGHLLFWKCTMKDGLEPDKLKNEIVKSNMSFSKKPIQQISVVAELAIFVTLSDGCVSAYRLDPNSCDMLTTLQNMRGIISFSLDVQLKTTLTGGQQTTLRMGVVTKRRVYLFYWKNNEFLPLKPEYLEVPDTPRRIIWTGQSICIGFKNEYSLITVLKGESKELFSVGNKQPEPLITRLEGDKLGLGIDEKLYVLDSDGNPALKHAIHWSGIPASVVNDHPYLIASIPSQTSVEVRSVEPHQLLQKLDVSPYLSMGRTTHMAACVNKRGRIYIASSNDVICLVSGPVKEQIDALMEVDNYEIALELIKGQNVSEKEKNKTVIDENSINARKAFYLFCKEKYKEAFDLFLRLETNPMFVIGLLPDLLSDSTRDKFEYPSPPPILEEPQLESALLSLNEYLVGWRTKLVALSRKGASTHSASSSSLNSSGHKYNNQQLRELVDTTLLKSYLRTNDALIASLLRLPDNQCQLEETERALISKQKYNELIIFYQRKGLHRKALDLLQSFSKKVSSSLSGHEPTVRYLQDLTVEDLEIIFEYATWIMKEHPSDGLRIFTDDLPEAELLPRECVLQYLEQVNSDTVIPYLEHIINIWTEKRTLFHNTLVNKYRERAAALLTEYYVKLSSLPESDSHPPEPAGLEPGELGDIRRRLLSFLDTSDHYSHEMLVSFLLKDQLYEEWATVMGKMNKHDRALSVYVCHLGDLRKAEAYCEKMYSKDPLANRDVFLTLLDIYLSEDQRNPFEGEPYYGSDLLRLPNRESPLKTSEGRLKVAIDLLTRYPTKLDPKSVIKVIPPTLPIRGLSRYLIMAHAYLVHRRQAGTIFRNVYSSQSLQAQEERISLEKGQRVVVTEIDICAVCRKKLGQCDFVRYPNNELVHYKCKGRGDHLYT